MTVREVVCSLLVLGFITGAQTGLATAGPNSSTESQPSKGQGATSSKLREGGKPGQAKTFGFEDVAAQAQALAGKPFTAAESQVPEWLHKISYDQWRDIRFRPEKALWRDEKLPFQVQLFHPGLFYDRTVRVNLIDKGGAAPLAFSPTLFDYGKNDFASRVPQDLGFAGLRIHAPIKTKAYFDEVIVFLGGTYFRAVGKDDVFGASARALAVDTALRSGEEFPYFREFWLVTPKVNEASVTIFALADSNRTTGAFRFKITPGAPTTVEVEGKIFQRGQVEKLAIAPLTSMFFFGENSSRPVDNFRPEVHDSDGMLMVDGNGEWIWRPLENPRTLQINSFQAKPLRGFGLLQRDREFDHYQDLETRQEIRPGVWIEPVSGFDSGRIEVVQIPTKDDTNDNIVAFWVPDGSPPANQPLAFSYKMSWGDDDPSPKAAGRVTATRRESAEGGNAVRFVVDFAGDKLAELPPATVLRGVLTVLGGNSRGEIVEQHVEKNPVTGGFRLSFLLRPKGGDPVELRAYLDQDGHALTETWTYTVSR